MTNRAFVSVICRFIINLDLTFDESLYNDGFRRLAWYMKSIYRAIFESYTLAVENSVRIFKAARTRW